MNTQEIDNAYKEAMKLAAEHYENFPVISLFIKKDLRKHVAVIYHFARNADDIADEGNFTIEERLTLLKKEENKLKSFLQGNYSSPIDSALHHTITTLNLNPQHFFDLLKAFKQDVTKKRYNDFDEVLDYCRHSANPVGRLILELHNIRDEVASLYSDQICTALQLTNFYQDIQIDFDKDRIYIPLDEMIRFNVKPEDFESKKITDDFRKLMKFQLERAQNMFIEGEKLIPFLNRRLRFQILWTISGGKCILKKIIDINYDVLNIRPTLSKFEYFYLFIKSFFYGRNSKTNRKRKQE